MVGDLASGEIAGALRPSSVLCLPMGSMEQHGPHLPLNTDTVIAEGLTRRIVARWGDAFDLWQLPAVPVGLSREHDWAPGTLSLSVSGMTTYLRDLCREIARALPARHLLIVNGHGGNRGILEAVTRELRGDFGLNSAAFHLGAAMSAGAAVPEIHAGKDETSVMLVLAPGLVRREALASLQAPPDDAAVRALVLDPVASFPWRSDDPRLSRAGIMGDARDSSAEHGEAIVARVVEAAGGVIRRLIESAPAAGG
jgi:creatinine amidohydrolase/Fe(II)-dependent formamide hydrolase-like protein